MKMSAESGATKKGVCRMWRGEERCPPKVARPRKVSAGSGVTKKGVRRDSAMNEGVYRKWRDQERCLPEVASLEGNSNSVQKVVGTSHVPGFYQLQR
ncbi:hypothetical protein HanRHA438_Chr17g0826351 [Helianthus annuus]|nr:hypothetical protein HanRHA438_Chr17g0826351 [Helianthus annuus]